MEYLFTLIGTNTGISYQILTFINLKSKTNSQGLTNQKKIHLPTEQVKKKMTCPVEKLACPDFFFQK